MQGIHLVGDLEDCGCDDALMYSCDAVEKLLVAECTRAGLTAVARKFHQFGAAGAPAGVTGVILLEESHACVHTWPELGCVTLDVYVCSFSRDNASAARELFLRLVEAFAPERAHSSELQRGVGAFNPKRAAGK
jgi:S-adenosylmethionine decarboxylase proenzyme